MAAKKSIVYLEDLEAPPTSQATEPAGEAGPGTVAVASNSSTAPSKSASKDVSVTKASNKRQATLMDMFSGAGSRPAAKKLRLENSSSSITSDGASKRVTVAGTKAGQTLNSIPFSLSAYVESMSDDEKRLLALECDTMGKSW